MVESSYMWSIKAVHLTRIFTEALDAPEPIILACRLLLESPILECKIEQELGSLEPSLVWLDRRPACHNTYPELKASRSSQSPTIVTCLVIL